MENIDKDTVYDVKAIIKRSICAFIIPAISFIYPLLNKPTGRETMLNISIDRMIPFNKYFILPYISWYFYVGFFLILISVFNKEGYFKLLISLVVGMLISYGIFYIFPTYVQRPVIYKTDIFSGLVVDLYARDNPYNCFPSVHVLNSVLVATYVNKQEKFARGVKIISTIIAILIILSTMFLKQHYFLDVVAGTIMAYVLYFVINGIWNGISRKHNI